MRWPLAEESGRKSHGYRSECDFQLHSLLTGDLQTLHEAIALV
jgi:hypothetical protein